MTPNAYMAIAFGIMAFFILSGFGVMMFLGNSQMKIWRFKADPETLKWKPEEWADRDIYNRWSDYPNNYWNTVTTKVTAPPKPVAAKPGKRAQKRTTKANK